MDILAVGFYPPRVGGSGQCGWNIAKEIAKNGHKIRIFTEDLPGDIPEQKNITINTVDLNETLSPSVKSFKRARKYFKWSLSPRKFKTAMRESIQNKKPDVILVNYAAPFISFVLKLAKTFNIPIVSVYHGTDVHNLVQPEYRTVYKTLLKQYKLSDGGIAVADYLKNILKLAGIRNVITIPNVIDKNIFKPYEKEEDLRRVKLLREELGIPEDALVLGHVSTLRPIKNPFIMVHAAEKIKESTKDRTGPPIHFLIIGEGPLKEEMEELAKTKGVQDMFHFAGRVEHDDMPKYTNLMDVGLCTSLRESSSLTLMEAQASGKPVISTNVGGIPEHVIHNKDGLLFENGNYEDFAKQVLRIANPRMYDILAEGSISKTKRTSMARTGQKYVNFIRTVIDDYKEKRSVGKKRKRKKTPKKVTLTANL